MFHNSLCRMMVYPQLRQWSTVKDLPHTQLVVRPVGSHPYLRHRASRNEDLCWWKLCSQIVSTDNQLEAPFSAAHSICLRRSWDSYSLSSFARSLVLLEFLADTSETDPDWADCILAYGESRWPTREATNGEVIEVEAFGTVMQLWRKDLEYSETHFLIRSPVHSLSLHEHHYAEGGAMEA